MNFVVKYIIPGIAVTSLVFAACSSSGEKEGKTGKAGDQLDLFAVLKTFEGSSSPEAFEKSLNSSAEGVNNLDLNEDGQTDYIKVTDKKIDDASHVLVLQVDVAEGETQDVATIQIQKTGEQEASLQIVGDEDLYGDDYIVEPKQDVAAAGFVVATTYAVNVWTWPAVTYIYSPSYVVWTSPYYYEYYPVWWEPWPVVAYDVYYPVVSVHHVHYGFSDGYRFVHVHENYHNHYRVKTKFSYHEKNYGLKHGDVHVKNHNKGNDGGWKGNDNAWKENSGNDKHDNGGGKQKDNTAKAVPAKNDAPGGNDKARSNDFGKSSGNDKGGAPKQEAKKSAPSYDGGGNKQSAPKAAAPKQQNTNKGGGAPKGGNGGGGKGGGKHR